LAQLAERLSLDLEFGSGGKAVYYIYADAARCNCAYVGTPQAYAAYQNWGNDPNYGGSDQQSNAMQMIDSDVGAPYIPSDSTAPNVDSILGPDFRSGEQLRPLVGFCAMATSHSRIKVAIVAVGVVLAGYCIVAYIALPSIWTHYERQKGLAGVSMLTRTAQGIPGDPINVGLVGSREDVLCAMHTAAWYPADPITFRSSLEIVGSVVLDRPYRDAPVSSLFYEGRREDLAFEQPDGKSADRRHHVRFWEVLKQGEEGRPVWLGSVTFDRGVGLSRYTAQVTHHIAPDIDAERDRLTGDLKAAKVVEAIYEVSGIGPTLNGRNGEGDQYYTDGELEISRLVIGCNVKAEAPVELSNPPLIIIKNLTWEAIAKLLQPSAVANTSR
jgi:hypothetical protein